MDVLTARLPTITASSSPIICFSHLRWDFVLQRPQHLMRRFANDRQVFFFEEYIPTEHHLAYLEFHPFADTTVIAVRPRIPKTWDEAARERALAGLVDQLISIHRAEKPVLWFYTPMMYPIACHVDAAAIVYDCMDELSNFRFAPKAILERERSLMARADVVFTGGHSIFEAKRLLHDNIHPFPSSVDSRHFGTARQKLPEPSDQKEIAGPRLGYFGVIDERLDLGLIAHLAAARPLWSIVLVGPIVKLDLSELPHAPNIHYLGQKDYAELPAYLAGWDAALMPFAINDATRFISPTKTPEYLAGGKPVVSTPIRDVMRMYEGLPGVAIAATPDAFVAACEDALALARAPQSWLPAVDQMLAAASWDKTHQQMAGHLNEAIRRSSFPPQALAKTPRRTRAVSRKDPYDVLIVGAGFAGSVLAERLAVGSGKRVLVCDRRPHIGGNAYDHYNEAGVLVHRYGPHIFHTNSDEIFSYLSRFTKWRPYEHRVLASVAGKLLPVPINRTTLNGLYDLNLNDEEEAAAFLASRAEPVETIRTSRDVVVSQIGSDLYRAFFEGYTRKQWGLDPSELDKSVTARVPTRTSTDDRYFLDRYQAMPRDGFTRLFENMLDHDNIDLALGADYRELRAQQLAPRLIFTGPIDEFFDHRFGALPYRSLTFRHETLDQRRFQPVAVVNYPDEAIPYTRITEYKHLTGQVHPKTSISYETASSEGDPYYPVPRPENQELYRRYEELSKALPDVHFVGRLGSYKYYNMDQVVGQALATYRRLAKAWPKRERPAVTSGKLAACRPPMTVPANR